MKNPTPPSRLRWYRFSSRDLLWLIALIAVGMYGVRERNARIHEENAAESKIRSMEWRMQNYETAAEALRKTAAEWAKMDVRDSVPASQP